MRNKVLVILAVLVAALSVPALAALEDPLIPVQNGVLNAGPVVEEDAVPVPLAEALPVAPVYIRTLPGLVFNNFAKNNSGTTWLSDLIVIKQSVVKDGKVIIPPGGLVYSNDWMANDPGNGSPKLIAGEQFYTLRYEDRIVGKSNVVLERNKPVQIGDQVFWYQGTAGYGTLAEAVIYVSDLRRDDWYHAGESPATFALGPSAQKYGKYGGKANWYGIKPNLPEGKQAFFGDFNQMYAWSKDITPQSIKFSTIYAADQASQTVAKKRVFFDWAAQGQMIDAGAVKVMVHHVDEGKGTVHVQVMKDGKVVSERTLGPLSPELMWLYPNSVYTIDAMLFVDHADDVAVQLYPFDVETTKTDVVVPIKSGKAHLEVYTGLQEWKDGQPYPQDTRFAVNSMGCPQMHNHGTIFYNRSSIVLSPGKAFDAFGGYFKIVLDEAGADKVRWHLEDKLGNKSPLFEKTGKTLNIDTLVGNTWAVASYDYYTWAKYGETGVLEETYNQLLRIYDELQKAKK